MAQISGESGESGADSVKRLTGTELQEQSEALLSTVPALLDALFMAIRQPETPLAAIREMTGDLESIARRYRTLQNAIKSGQPALEETRGPGG